MPLYQERTSAQKFQSMGAFESITKEVVISYRYLVISRFILMLIGIITFSISEECTSSIEICGQVLLWICVIDFIIALVALIASCLIQSSAKKSNLYYVLVVAHSLIVGLFEFIWFIYAQARLYGTHNCKQEHEILFVFILLWIIETYILLIILVLLVIRYCNRKSKLKDFEIVPKDDKVKNNRELNEIMGNNIINNS